MSQMLVRIDKKMNDALIEVAKAITKGGIDYHDVKIHEIDKGVDPEWGFLSTTDSSFANGKVGKYIREAFKERSRFEE